MLTVWILACFVCFLAAATMFHCVVREPWIVIAFWALFLGGVFILGLFV